MRWIAHPLLILLTLMVVPTVAAQRTVTGKVLDAETGLPMTGVHVYETGTARGTVTNADGRFSLSLPALPAAITAQHMGYDAVETTVDTVTDLDIRLRPAVLEMDELVVSAEDFATRIMRAVIDRKARMYRSMRSFSSVGFTRLVLERGETIVHVSDAAFDLTWRRDGATTATPSAVSATSSLAEELPLPAAHTIVNFYDDLIPVQGLQMIGPTHPDALSYYLFRLETQRSVGDQIVYDVNVTPRGETEATFVGQISVAGDVMLEARLRPARHVVFPDPVRAWDVGYTQHFRAVGDTVWVPVSLNLDGRLVAAVDARTDRSVGLRRRSVLSEHRLNVEGRTGAPPPWNDPEFRYGQVLLPMTDRERRAIQQLEPLTLRQAFPPERTEGALAPFLDPDRPGQIRWPVIMGYRFRFRFNRVDGLLAAVGQEMPFSPRLQATWELGQATGYGRIRSHISARYGLLPRITARVTFERDIEPAVRDPGYPPAFTSVQSALGGRDYYDYLWRERVGVALHADLGVVEASAGLTQDEEESVERRVSRSWPYARSFRANPSIGDGRYRTAHLAASVGGDGPAAVHVRAERAMESLGSDAGFTLLSADLSATVPTFLRRRPDPPRLEVLLRAATSFGHPPVQRRTGIDAGVAVFGSLHLNRWGAFRSISSQPVYGDRLLAAFWRHEFTTLPFELLRAWPLVRTGTGLALFGAHGLVDGPSPYSIHEIGLSVTRALGSPLRVDAAVRLDRPALTLGIGLRL